MPPAELCRSTSQAPGPSVHGWGLRLLCTAGLDASSAAWGGFGKAAQTCRAPSSSHRARTGPNVELLVEKSYEELQKQVS